MCVFCTDWLVMDCRPEFYQGSDSNKIVINNNCNKKIIILQKYSCLRKFFIIKKNYF